MHSANDKTFRAGLKEYMDAAVSEPIRINRRDGESFILMAEDRYDELRNEIESLHRRLLGMTQILDEQVTVFNKKEDRTKRFKKK